VAFRIILSSLEVWPTIDLDRRTSAGLNTMWGSTSRLFCDRHNNNNNNNNNAAVGSKQAGSRVCVVMGR
jgi:hypothetical protein